MKLNKEDLINIKRIKQAYLNGVESYVSQHLPGEFAASGFTEMWK